MCEELKCKVCGKLASDDTHFNKKRELCNRHYTQWCNHGEFLDNKCIINPQRKMWSEAEVKDVCDKYLSGMDEKDIAVEYNCTVGAIDHILKRGEIVKEVRYGNDTRFKAPYQDYEWCYERYVIKGMSYKEMAEEAHTKPRTIQKWCSEKHRLNRRTLRKELHLTNKQKELIMFSLLGDGHISKREQEPLFIVSHAINQKDYLFWKYDVLKSVCNNPPKLYTDAKSNFGTNKMYYCQDFYRFNTKILDDLIPIRNMSRSEIITQLNEFGLAIHLLDDGSHSDGFWGLCYAAFTEEEKEIYRKTLKEKFDIDVHIHKDGRYVGFDKTDSQKICDIILRNIPNDLDIIKYKILKDDSYAKIC